MAQRTRYRVSTDHQAVGRRPLTAVSVAVGYGLAVSALTVLAVGQIVGQEHLGMVGRLICLGATVAALMITSAVIQRKRG